MRASDSGSTMPHADYSKTDILTNLGFTFILIGIQSANHKYKKFSKKGNRNDNALFIPLIVKIALTIKMTMKCRCQVLN